MRTSAIEIATDVLTGILPEGVPLGFEILAARFGVHRESITADLRLPNGMEGEAVIWPIGGRNNAPAWSVRFDFTAWWDGDRWLYGDDARKVS